MTSMKTNSLYLNNIFLEVLSYFGKPNKRFKSSTIIGLESFFYVSCEYTKKDWKGKKKKHLFTCQLHWYKDSLILHAMTTDREATRPFGSTRIDMRDKETDIKWDIISFCELNEIDFK